jgi:[protein-PII] uridylyltransferase
MLYLLTYADTRAVGEGVWTPVKGRFLRDLWRRSAAVLSEEDTVGVDPERVARARRRLQKDLTLKNLPEAEVAEHIQSMPPLSLLNQSLAQMALHIEFVRRVRSGE